MILEIPSALHVTSQLPCMTDAIRKKSTFAKFIILQWKALRSPLPLT